MTNVPLDIESYLREETGLPVANRPFGTIPVIEDLWDFFSGCIGEGTEVTTLQTEMYGYPVASAREVNASFYESALAETDNQKHHIVYSNVDMETNLRDWLTFVSRQIERSDHKYPSLSELLSEVNILTIDCNASSNSRSIDPYPRFDSLNDITKPTLLLLDVTDGSNERIVNVAINAMSQQKSVKGLFFATLDIQKAKAVTKAIPSNYLKPIVHVQQSSSAEVA